MPTLLEKAEALRALHKGPRLLVLANVWDGASARIVAKAGFPALATSSAAVAYVYGYPDGQRITRDEMMEMVERIAHAVPLPVSADVEAGYGESTEAAADTAPPGPLPRGGGKKPGGTPPARGVPSPPRPGGGEPAPRAPGGALLLTTRPGAF